MCLCPPRGGLSRKPADLGVGVGGEGGVDMLPCGLSKVTPNKSWHHICRRAGPVLTAIRQHRLLRAPAALHAARLAGAREGPPAGAEGGGGDRSMAGESHWMILPQFVCAAIFM